MYNNLAAFIFIIISSRKALGIFLKRISFLTESYRQDNIILSLCINNDDLLGRVNLCIKNNQF